MTRTFCDCCHDEIHTLVCTYQLAREQQICKQIHLCHPCDKKFRNGNIRLDFLPAEGHGWPTHEPDENTTVPSSNQRNQPLG